ncbi:MAG: tetratricopeptide repeat protein [Salaquimonas sp.]|jgi:tetratricopeptide (TPR) repeat protein|nr:tetratricopeptide repeat protein [Salaquimonas sp.]
MNSVMKTATAAFLAAGLAAGSTSFAAAAGDSGGDSASAPKECPKGEVWDPEAKTLFGKGKCVAEADFKKKPASEQQGLLYNYGRGMAKAGHYEKAIAALKMAPDQEDPRVLNYLGYSNRKLGNMDVALGYYHAAVAQNPDFSLVREYLGEAYIQLGLLEKAREQLSEIERICGSKTCGEYGQLANLIVDSQTTQD